MFVLSSSSSSSSLSLPYFNLFLLIVSLFLAPGLSISQTATPDLTTPVITTTPSITTTPAITTTPESTREGGRQGGGGEIAGKTRHVEWREEGRGNQSEYVERREDERRMEGGNKLEDGVWREEGEQNKSEYIERKEDERIEGRNKTKDGEWKEKERGKDEERRGGGGGGSKTSSLEGKKGMKVVKHFYLWTRRNPGNSSAQLLDPTQPDTISHSLFRASKTFVIIHGFLGWGTEPWILHFKDKLLRVFPGSNVVSVGWPAGTSWWLPSYYNAVARVPGVAQDLTALLHNLTSTCHLDLRDLHLIGHSLGAHVAGLAAAPLHTVGRITGLDPAGLTYHNVPANQRLDASDAAYVDVIHTNGCTTLAQWLDCYGINENLGHSDFWPNGGKHQPSCSKKKERMTNGEIGCSHEMAYVYYIESLDYSVDQTYYLARPCSSWEDYQAGRCSCGVETQYMGVSVNTRLNGTFYLSTNDFSPYAAKDKGCPPGSATGPGVRIISLTLISASALIVGTSAIVLITRGARRWARRGSEGGGGVDGAGASGGDRGGIGDSGISGSSDGDVVGTSDKVPLVV